MDVYGTYNKLVWGLWTNSYSNWGPTFKDLYPTYYTHYTSTTSSFHTWFLQRTSRDVHNLCSMRDVLISLISWPIGFPWHPGTQAPRQSCTFPSRQQSMNLQMTPFQNIVKLYSMTYHLVVWNCNLEFTPCLDKPKTGTAQFNNFVESRANISHIVFRDLSLPGERKWRLPRVWRRFHISPGTCSAFSPKKKWKENILGLRPRASGRRTYPLAIYHIYVCIYVYVYMYM